MKTLYKSERNKKSIELTGPYPFCAELWLCYRIVEVEY